MSPNSVWLDHAFLRSVRIPLLSFVVLVFLLVVGCSSSSEPEVVATSAQEKPTVLATTSPVPPTSTPQPDVVEQTVEDLLASIERAVEELRGIDTPTPVEHHFVDKAGMQEQLAELLDDPETIEQIAHESALFKLLGVIPQDADLAGIYDGLFGSQVLGLYDPEKEQFFVLGDDQSGAESIDTEAQLTYAHEYVHRLQDAKFDLETIKELSTGDDMSLAISALIEGDAISAQSQYILANYDFAELGELFEAALAAEADLPDSPYFLQKSLEFPYTDGAAFVAVLLQMGNFAAVDAVFADLPKSTEQVLHPEKYLDGELPDELDIPDDALSDVEGSAWSLQAENVLGEFFLKTWLEALGSGNAANAAAGWGGDAYAVFENGPGENALAISIAWDTDLDAKEFIDELSDTFAGNPDYQSRGSGLDGILEAWEGPGGYIVMSRWEVGDGTDMVGVAITPEGGLSHKLNFALATPEGLSQ